MARGMKVIRVNEALEKITPDHPLFGSLLKVYENGDKIVKVTPGQQKRLPDTIELLEPKD